MIFFTARKNAYMEQVQTQTVPVLSVEKVHKPFQGFRKVYHVLAASIFPLSYLYPPLHLNFAQVRQVLLIICGSCFVLSFLLDLVRLTDKQFNSKFMKVFSILVRQTETNRFNGSTFLCLAFFIVILFFSKNVAVSAMFFLSLGDAAAELSGKNFGRVKIFQRSFEGTLGFFLVAFLIAFTLFEDWRIAALGALAGALVELFSFDVDDNLTVPIGSALVLWIAVLLFHLGGFPAF